MSSIWDDVVGQKQAIGHLRAAVARVPVHAYLFVGPSGSTKLEAARAFAASLMSGGETRDHRDARLIIAGEHPDVREVQRVGASISAEQAKEVVRVSSLAPTEGARKVLILDEFHLLSPHGAALMLKTIEEPPESTTFHHSRRLRAARSDHYLVAMCTHRFSGNRRRRDRGAPPDRGHQSSEVQWLRRRLPWATSTAPASWRPTSTWRTVGRPSSKRPNNSMAPVPSRCGSLHASLS